MLFTISSLFAVDIAMSSSVLVKISLSVRLFPSVSAAQAYDMDTRKIMTSNGMIFIDFFTVFPPCYDYLLKKVEYCPVKDSLNLFYCNFTGFAYFVEIAVSVEFNGVFEASFFGQFGNLECSLTF